MSFDRVAIIGLGLLGGSIGLAVAEHLPETETTGYDADPTVRRRAAERGLVGRVCESAAEAVAEADLVILCVPVGAMAAAARDMAGALALGALVSDVGSSKRTISAALQAALGGAASDGRIAVVAGRRGSRQVLGDGEADRAPEQAEADDRNPFEAHAALSAISRRAMATSSICSAVPMVIRSPCGRPWPGRWRTA